MSGPTVHGSRLPHSDPSAVDGPPPGFDVDDAHPVAPEVPPEPTFGKNTARPCVGRGDNDGSSSSQQGQSAPDSTQREWSDHGYGQWDVHREQPWGNSWETGDKRAEWTDWNRRSSWDTAASTTIDGGDTSVRKQRGNQDPWRDGNDPWSGNKTRAEWKERGDWQDHRQEDGRQDPWRDPWADGRADQERERDYPDRQQAAWSNGGAKQGTAWNGWSFFDNGGFKAQGGNQALVPGGGRASEKLAVPSFSGEDGEDVGGSARSYLRQVEAWRRMTLLPATQQGLVLYQNLTGKAWIAAEELSVDRLASSDGVEYFVQWLNARFLDLEVARIGRAFSEFFRKLRRKPSQSIREYNTEYDRLHARLREVGCSLPQECAAWLYVDRLQLDEPQELNLLASVGNQYHLGKLQQAAVLHDRGHRKPWEARGRKPHTAHLTEAGDDGPGADEDEELEDFDGDGIPEEVAIAYATYQSAKDKYKEQSRARGYQGDRAAGGGRDRGGQMPSSSREEKVKLMKAKSYCMSCGKKGHWHKDPECPNRGGPKEVDMCHHVPAEVYALKHEGKTLLGITDTACAKSVAGTVWLQQYTEHTEQFQGKPQLVRESEAFKFGTGRIHHSAFHVLVRFKLGDKVVEMKTSIINGDIPLLLSKSALAQLGMVYDLAQNSADFTKVGLREFPLVTTSSGHPAIPIAPARCDDDCAKLVIQDGGVSESRVYMAFAVSEVQLLSEANRLGLVVHRTWSCEELKAVIQEHRMNDATSNAGHQMRSVTNLTLPELKVKATELGVQFPSNITKGNLLRLVRDHVGTPANELMKIGKYKGWEFQEIPKEYGMWAAREVRMNGNPHVELVRYAKWWEEDHYQKHYGHLEPSIEKNAAVPYNEDPPWATSSQPSEASAWTSEWKMTSLPGKHDDYPIPPKTTKRGASSSGYEAQMDAEIDKDTLEEIQKLEARLAVLKDKAKVGNTPTRNVIGGIMETLDLNYDDLLEGCCGKDEDAATNDVFLSDYDLERAKDNKYYNYECTHRPGDARDVFVEAIAKCDYSNATLLRLLNSTQLQQVKTQRDDVFGAKHAKVTYHTYGLYTHGGVLGVTNKTRENSGMVRYLNEFARRRLGEHAIWSSITVARDAKTEVHHDYNNLRGSKNYTFSIGQEAGGEVWVEDRGVSEDNIDADVKWRRIGSGQWVPGKNHNTNGRFYEFDPFLKHGTEPWRGSRWCLTYHTTRGIIKAKRHTKDFLRNCGFPLPRGGIGAEEGVSQPDRRPRRSIRKEIYNNAAKISVMLASLVCAAGSYMSDHVFPEVIKSPLVMFEIGGTEATEEAANLDKDVMEPMSWEDYRTPEGKEAAHHIVNGGYPRELRVHLRGKGDQPNDALTELVGNQLHSGGAVVIDGSVKDTLLIHDGFVAIRENFQQHWSGDDEDFFLVLFKNKDDNIGLQCHDRVHQVCAVTCEGQQRGSSDGPVMGAGGITFGEGTPNTIATALRRLHQNLGHPRGEDLLRHLRLAGCDTTVLKAARSMRCQVCDACAGPKVARPSTIPSMCDWNDTLGVDIFYAHDINDEKHAFLSVVDFGTTYHLAAKVDGTSADILERKFNELWILPFGPPKTIVLDLEGGPQVALGRLCDWHNITVWSVATQSHWQAGMVERQQAWWKSVWDRVIYQKSIAADEVDITAPIINGAKNELRRRCGYSPSQWVFGKAPRVAEELRDPDNGEKFVWDATEDSKFQRQAAIRASARVAFHQSQTDSRLRKALLQRTRVASRPFEVGESVHFWFKPKNRRRGEWAGPAVIVGKEGGNFWLSKSGRCRLTSPEHMRPTTPEEVGELLSMKGTQKEVEKLLDFDPDDQEVFEEPEDMDLDLEEYAPTDYEPEDDTEMPVLDPYEEIAEKILPAPTRRLKRKTAPADSEHAEHEALMLRSDLTRRGVEKRKEKELKWSEIPEEVHQKFRDAEKTQWDEHLAYDALQPLSLADSDRIRATVPAERILRCRWAYKDKNYARRREGEEVPWKCKSRLVIAGHTDPDLGTEQLTTDAPTLSRSGLSCMLQIVANGRSAPDPWTVAAGDIRCAFLTGSYLTRELYLHQPRTGFPGMHPGELVKIKKNVFGLATSPHEWWNDLRGGIFSIEIDIPHTGPEVKYKFEQCALDPCVFTLRKWKDGVFCEEPIAYIGCHVDDILIGAPQSLQKAMQKALSGTFPIDEWEENEFEFLGSKIRVSDYEVELSQEKYATTRLFQLDLPLNAKDEELASPELVSDNRSLIGALSWMSSTSRPDLTCSVSMAQQLQKSPTHGDIKFTNQTAHKAIQFKQRGLKYKSIPPDRMMIVIYHDAAWANVLEADPDEDYYVLTHEDNLAGLQREGPYALTGVDRKAKKGNSKVASQLGILVTFMDRGALSGEAGDFSIADWRSQAGQRVCRSTFGAETQACAEGLETGQYIRSMYESMLAGKLVSVEAARMPILCLSDCRSLYDHLNKQGVPRVPTDKRLAVDLAALRQGLRSEMWSDELPIGWLPGSAQRADVLTKPQNPTDWWETADQKVLLPLALGQRGGLVCDRQTTQRTSVKLERTSGIRVGSLFPFEYERIGSHQG
ncbi:Copia protein [Symbiodinium microadriaticum]|uniref:Copia protein n=1 Tax=Symbiodinium microadriaticum TaxID=2951 RepID=A0A1Q9CGY7_SYMMI|nr:Copia protein [Symbiodinium microadriaticum]